MQSTRQSALDGDPWIGSLISSIVVVRHGHVHADEILVKFAPVERMAQKELRLGASLDSEHSSPILRMRSTTVSYLSVFSTSRLAMC